MYDSESIIEKKVFENDPINFNSTNDETDFKDRSDDKGPEPEAIAVGMVGSNYYAFVGLERHGGVMAFDVTDVNSVKYVDFIYNIFFSARPNNISGRRFSSRMHPICPKGRNVLFKRYTYCCQ